MNGIPTLLWNYVQTRHLRRFRSRTELERWQDRRVQALLKRVLPAAPFYREQAQGLSLSDWRHFPTIDKSVMMANFDTLNTVGIKADEAMAVALEAERSRDFAPTLGEITVGLSSGTSGNRGLFLVSPSERFAWAGSILAKVLPGSLLDKQRIAFFLRANSNLYTTVKSRHFQFEFFDLLDAFATHVERLNTFQPTLLIAPPSMLRFLAEAVETGQLRLALERIVSVAEVLDPLDQGYIERQFGQAVHQVYQCTEGFLAASCAHGTLHLNEDLVVIQKEVVDEASGKFIPIITDFSRTTQPIIRYRLNDLLTEKSEHCPCGSIFMALESIEGRCDDVFYFPSSEAQLRAVFPDFVRRAIMEASPAIQEYRSVQLALDEIVVAFRAPDSERALIERQIEARLRDLCDRLDCALPVIRFVPYELKPSDKKLRRIERSFSLP